MTTEEMLAAFDAAYAAVGQPVPDFFSEAQAGELARGLGLPWVHKRNGKAWDRWNLAADFARRMRDIERTNERSKE